MKELSVGFLGHEKSSVTPRWYAQRSTSREINTLPWSTRIVSGYRRLHILLKREDWEMNWKKLYRLYREEGLTVCKRGGRQWAIGTIAPMAIP